MACEWYHFLISMLMLFFSLFSIIFGLFAAYFAGGKTKIASIILVIIGLIVMVLFLWCLWLIPALGPPPIQLCGCIIEGISAIIGGIIGVLISLGILLLIFLKL